MAKKRTKHSATTKAKIALEALREHKTIAQIGSEYQVAPSLVSKWKKEALSRLSELFATAKPVKDDKQLEALYEQIGRLQMEVTWLKKNAGLLEH